MPRSEFDELGPEDATLLILEYQDMQRESNHGAAEAALAIRQSHGAQRLNREHFLPFGRPELLAARIAEQAMKQQELDAKLRAIVKANASR